MPLLVLPVQEQQLARIHDVRMAVEVLVVGQRADVSAVGIATVQVQDHVVLLERPGALAAEIRAVGNEHDIAVGQIGRFLVRVQRFVGQLPQSGAVDVHLEQMRHLFDRPDALAEVSAEVALLGQAAASAIRPPGLFGIGEDQLVGIPREFQAADMPRPQATGQQRFGRILRAKSPFDVDVAAGRVRVPASDRDVAVASAELVAHRRRRGRS